MKTVKAREHFDEEVTEHSLEKAVLRGSQRPRQSLHATAVEYLADHGALFISFSGHTGIALPVANYPELANLSRTELASLEIGLAGSALCLDSRDLHVSIAGLVSASQPLMELASTVVAASHGRRSSEAKARAARENGQKGGRPRKLAPSASSPIPPDLGAYRHASKEAVETLYVMRKRDVREPYGHFTSAKPSARMEDLWRTGRVTSTKHNPSGAVTQALSTLKKSLSTNIDVGGLFSRSSIAHKWKAPWRALLLREAVAWRIQDLLQQSNTLYGQKSILGARILLRSAFETLAILIYVNQSIRSVVAGKTDFHAFSETTTRLLLGSRDKSTSFDSINILTILRKADVRYPGIEELYGALSESAHPNHEGMVLGYSKNGRENFVTTFVNRWGELYAEGHTDTLMLCLSTFEHEYNDEFPGAFEAIEQWIIANDATLESTKPNEVER